MPELPNSIIIGATLVATVWLVAIVLTVMLFHSSEQRRDRVQKKLVRLYFRKLASASADAEYESKLKTLNLLLATNIAADLMMLFVLIPVGWWLVDGAQGNIAGLSMVLIVSPVVALHPYIMIVISVLTRGANSRRERALVLGHEREE